MARYRYRSGRKRKLHYHGKCEYCQEPIWKEMRPKIRKYRFCGKKCKGQSLQAGNRSPNWGGGTKRDVHGYTELYCPGVPGANMSGYIREHRLIAQGMLARPLQHSEVVHHKDGDRANNHPTNLEVCSRGDHIRTHLTCTENNNEL